MLAWLMYALVVSLLVGVAAAAAERVLRLYNLPGRGAWVVAMGASVVVPVAALLTGGPPASIPALPAIGVGEAVARIGNPAGSDASGSGWMPHIDSMLSWGWAVASTIAVGWLGLSALRLRRSLDGRPTRSVGRVRVHITEEEGPACWGVPGGTARVLLPKWLRDLGPNLRRLAVSHEREHLRSGDSLLTAAGYLAVAAVPWNLPLWWHLRRLLRAVELDCDDRVLRNGADPKSYGDVLLTVAGRSPAPSWKGVALSENPSRLRGRIENLITPSRRNRPLRAFLLSAIALTAGVLAGETSPPPQSPPTAPTGSESETAGSERPKFIPYSEAPELQNPSRVTARLNDLYPNDLQEEGIGGTVTLWMYVDTDGDVTRSRVENSSGYRALDQAALKVSEVMEFSPALNRDQPRAVWIQQLIKFDPTATTDATSPQVQSGPSSDL